MSHKNVRLVKFKIKPGKKEKFKLWIETLKSRESEVIESFLQEGVLSESCFISEDENEVYYIVEAEDIQKAKDAYKKSTLKIDFDHRRAISETLEKSDEFLCLSYFSNLK